MFGKRKIDLLEQVRYVTCARISSPKQDLQSQVDSIEQYTANELQPKYVSVGHFEDTITTKKHWTKRKDGFMKVLNLAKAGKIDHVIFYSVFRLGRDPFENLEMARALSDEGVSMHFVSDHIYIGDGSNPTDEMFFLILSSMAKQERDRKQRRGIRGYQKWRKNNPDKIWGQQPKLRGKKLELFMEMYKAQKPISRPWDKRRQKSGDGMTWQFSYREMADILKINKATVGRYVKRLVNAGMLEPRTKEEKDKFTKIDHISPEAKAHAEATARIPRRPTTVEVAGEVIERETSMFDEKGNLHPAYVDETLGPFSKVTKKIAEELDSFEFTTYIQ